MTADGPSAGHALRAAAARTAVLLRNLPDPSAIVPGLSWSVAETAAHLVIALKNYRELVLGAADGRAVSLPAPDAETPTQYSAAYNAAELARYRERDTLRLADLLVPVPTHSLRPRRPGRTTSASGPVLVFP